MRVRGKSACPYPEDSGVTVGRRSGAVVFPMRGRVCGDLHVADSPLGRLRDGLKSAMSKKL